MCADGEAAAVRQFKAKFKGKGFHGKEEKRKDVRRSQQQAGRHRTSQFLPDTVFILHRERRVHVGLGSIAIKRRTPTDSRMIPEESEGMRGPREAEGRGETEAGRGDVNQGRWDRLERVCLKKNEMSE